MRWYTGNKFPMHLSCGVIMTHCLLDPRVPSSTSLQQPAVAAQGFSRCLLPSLFLWVTLLSLLFLLLDHSSSLGQTPWVYPALRNILTLIQWFALIWFWLQYPSHPSNASHGFPPSHMPSLYTYTACILPTGFPGFSTSSSSSRGKQFLSGGFPSPWHPSYTSVLFRVFRIFPYARAF